MKNLFNYFLVVLLLSGTYSCVDMVSLNQQEEEREDTNSGERILTKSASEIDTYMLIEDGYLEMTDNQYRLTLSRKEAKELGYSVDGYDALCDLIDNTNAKLQKRIKEWENDPEITSYEITDCTYSENVSEPQISLASLQTRSEQDVVMPSGYLTSADASHSYAQVNGPKEMTKIGGTCFSDPEGYHVCHMVEMRNGLTVNSATRFGYGYLEVRASNICTLHYDVQNALFGSYTWSGMTSDSGTLF